MELSTEQSGGVLVLAPGGRLDTDSASDLELALDDALAGGARHFVIDLSKISYVSSAGLRVLLSLAKKLEGGQGSLRLSGLNPQVKQVFDIAGFTKLFALYPDRAKALAEHPHAKAPEPGLGALAAKIMGAQAQRKASAESNKVASAAAGLLGAKPGSTPGPAQASASAKATSAPAASTPAPVRAPASAPPAKKPGFFARLFGRK